MNLNDSSLSTSSSSQPTLARIVANVVETQQQLVSQIQSVTTALESLKLEHNTSVQALREDWRRTDDRSQRQIEELREAHKKEVDRLLDLIKTLLEKENSRQDAPRQTTSVQQGFPMPSNPLFATPDVQRALAMQNDPQVRMMMQQMQQMQQQQALQQQQQLQNAMLNAQAQAQAQAAGVNFHQGGIAANVASQIVPKPAAPTVPVPVLAPSVPTQSTIFPPAQPVIKPPVVDIKPPADNKLVAAPIVKQDEKPVAPLPLKAEGLFGSKPSTPAAPVATSAASPAISFGGFGAKSSIFGTPTNIKTEVKDSPKAVAEEHSDDEKVEEYEPQIDFKPVVPLPELVEVVTGEEGEEVVFEEKSKLFRYAETKEWKERGVGMLKILKDPKTLKYRIVMRREQVHKVCANHPLASGMTINKMPKNDKAAIWHCMDFSEEVQKHEQLCAKFASPVIADKFVKIFKEGVDAASKASPVKNDPKAKVEPVKDTKKEEPKKEEKKAEATQGFGDKFKLKEGEWNCSACYTRNTSDITSCPCCGTNKDGTTGGSKDSFPKSIIPTAPTGPSKFTFGLAAAAAAKEVDTTPSAPAKSGLFGSSISTGNSTFGSSAGGSSPSIFGGNKTTTTTTTTAGSTASTFSFGSGNTSNTASPNTSLASFSFKNTEGKSLFGGQPSTVFGQTAAKEEDKTQEKKAEAPGTPATGKVFGSGFSTGISFASFASSTGNSGGIFSKENSEKAQAELASQQKSKLFSTIKKDDKKEEGSGDEDGEADGEYEPDVNFEPVVPLPELVKVVTGEENEEVVFLSRAKLFRFDADLKENKERGLGDLKILKNPDTGKYRVVMRREQVHKLCANFNISKSINLKPKPNKPEVYSWMCKDFSEDNDGKDEIFTAKFKNEELATKFFKTFIEAQEAS